MLGDVSLTQHLNEFEALLLALQARGVVVKGEDVVVQLMLSLPPTYFTSTIALTMLSDKLTFTKLKSVLIEEHKIKALHEVGNAGIPICRCDRGRCECLHPLSPTCTTNITNTEQNHSCSRMPSKQGELHYLLGSSSTKEYCISPTAIWQGGDKVLVSKAAMLVTSNSSCSTKVSMSGHLTTVFAVVEVKNLLNTEHAQPAPSVVGLQVGQNPSVSSINQAPYFCKVFDKAGLLVIKSTVYVLSIKIREAIEASHIEAFWLQWLYANLTCLQHTNTHHYLVWVCVDVHRINKQNILFSIFDKHLSAWSKTGWHNCCQLVRLILRGSVERQNSLLNTTK